MHPCASISAWPKDPLKRVSPMNCCFTFICCFSSLVRSFVQSFVRSVVVFLCVYLKTRLAAMWLLATRAIFFCFFNVPSLSHPSNTLSPLLLLFVRHRRRLRRRCLFDATTFQVLGSIANAAAFDGTQLVSSLSLSLILNKMRWRRKMKGTSTIKMLIFDLFICTSNGW